MTRLLTLSVFASSAWVLAATPVFAGSTPAPLLAAGPVGLAVLAVGGVGYLGLRAIRRRKD